MIYIFVLLSFLLDQDQSFFFEGRFMQCIYHFNYTEVHLKRLDGSSVSHSQFPFVLSGAVVNNFKYLIFFLKKSLSINSSLQAYSFVSSYLLEVTFQRSRVDSHHVRFAGNVIGYCFVLQMEQFLLRGLIFRTVCRHRRPKSDKRFRYSHFLGQAPHRLLRHSI